MLEVASWTSGLCLIWIGRVSILSASPSQSYPSACIIIKDHTATITDQFDSVKHTDTQTFNSSETLYIILPHSHLHHQMSFANSLQSLFHHPNHHHHHSLPRLLPLKPTSTTSLTYTHNNNNNNNTPSIPHSLTKTQSFNTLFSFSTLATSTTASEAALAAATSTSLDLLAIHLTTQNFREADNETRRLLIALAGESAVKRGYVFFSEVQFISSTHLKSIDDLWLKHSNNKFGYSVQKSIWEKSDRDFSRFFVRVGWMKKLDTEVSQYNYRAFPNEFTWELTPETPVGHLPLTNALRGTQLLRCVLSHPAFDDVDDADVDEDDAKNALLGTTKPLSKKVFKSNYSF